MNNYVIGIDGGSTKTQCALFDLEGNKIDFLNWGPLNHEVLRGGFEGFRVEMYDLLRCILQRNKVSINNIKKGVFGIAGVDTKDQHRIISKMITETGIEDMILCNDAYLGIKAGCISGAGICVINGTGCTVAGINPQGEMLQIGGQGALTGDKGGGSMLGVAAISAVYNYLFRCGKSTILKELLFEDLMITSKYEFMDTITQKLNDQSIRIAEMNRYLFTAAHRNDEVACEILRDVGRELGLSVNGMIRELNFGEAERVEIVLAGSVNVKGDHPGMIDSLKEQVFRVNGTEKISFSMLAVPPVAGAVIWALEGYCSSQNLFQKISGQF
ncbi:MAG: hypothetical protein N2484_08980 [Clostridia bacterium]|nr:hypothetical protein [Clostridia bacterium]